MEFEFFGALRGLGIEWASALMLAMLIGLLVTGMPLAFVTLLVALFFALGWFGPASIGLITSRIYSFVTSYVFVAVPMFVLMASILDRSGIARDLFDSMRVLGGRVRGALGVQTLFVAVMMAAMSGIIGGEVVLLGLLALPQMLRLGYDKKLAIGVCCAGGALGTMIPPSIVLIIYGLIANVSISDLFTASFTPGFMLAGFYVAYVLLRSKLQPHLAAIPDASETADVDLKLVALALARIVAALVGVYLLTQLTGTIYPGLLLVVAYVAFIYMRKGDPTVSPSADNAERAEWYARRFEWGLAMPVLVIGVVLGSIYSGIASVTEAAGLGVVGVMAVTLLRGEMNGRLLMDSAVQTLSTCGMIVWIGIGASAIIGVYNLMGGNRFVESLLLGISEEPLIILLVMMGILLILGLFLDWVGVALLTMPIFVPIIITLGYDPIWFGVLFAMNMQVSFLSPPFGPAAFYLKSVAPPDISLSDIFTSLLPFIGLQVLALIMLIAFPQIAMWPVD